MILFSLYFPMKVAGCHLHSSLGKSPSSLAPSPVPLMTALGLLHDHGYDLELYKLSFSRFGAKLWNEIPCHIRHLPKNKFKKTLRKLLSDILNSGDDYIDTPTLIKKVQSAKHVEKYILA